MRKNFFVNLTGYIDESYSGECPPRMFSLTCLLAKGSEWPWIEMAWQKCVEEKNASLKAEGRTTILRYHSVDINNFREDFSGWNGPERQVFCEKLIRVFARHEWGYEGYLVNLHELVDEWPETSSDPIGFAYDVLLKFLMLEMGQGINSELPDCRVKLFHERCSYDGAYQNSFNALMTDPTFAYKHCFSTIAPMGWEDCVLLQPADLVAYGNFKEGYRTQPGEKPRERRIIFKELLSLDSFVPHLKQINRANIAKLKGIFDAAKERQHGRMHVRRDREG